jgi:hypothetical protein
MSNILLEETDTPRESSVLGTLYCHDCDPNSLKLLLFVLEAGLLPRISEVVHVTKHNEESLQAYLLTKHSQRHGVEPSKKERGDTKLNTHGIFPVCVCASDDTMLTGADRIINMLMDDVQQSRNIDWKQMVVFNFFSCGMKMEMDMIQVGTLDKIDFYCFVTTSCFMLVIHSCFLHCTGDDMMSMMPVCLVQVKLSMLFNSLHHLRVDLACIIIQLDHLQQESERMTIHLTEQSNSQIQKLNLTIGTLKRLVVKEITTNTTGVSLLDTTALDADSSTDIDSEGAAGCRNSVEDVGEEGEYDRDVEELRYLLKYVRIHNNMSHAHVCHDVFNV